MNLVIEIEITKMFGIKHKDNLTQNTLSYTSF
jgi:hypothetical protein